MTNCRICKHWHYCDAYCLGFSYEQSIIKTLKLKTEQWLIRIIERGEQE